jgi:hypothetical protein
MGFHLFCIMPARLAVPADCTGLDGRPVVAAAAGDLAAWASELPAPPQPDVPAMRTHNAVIVAAMSDTVTPVPVRFGQWCATREEVAERVAERADHWTALLDRFAGRAEYGMRVVRPDPDAERDVRAAAPESGRDYMAELARKQARTAARRADGERIAARVSARLAGLVVEQRAEPGTGAVLLSLAHLVAWGAADEYHVAMRELGETERDTRWTASGPWPPYSFVE